MHTTTITHTLRTLLLAAALPALNACTSTDFVTETPDGHTSGEKTTLTAYLADDNAATSRMTHEYTNAKTIALSWEVGDSIKVYKGGIGAKFEIKKEADITGKKATFEGSNPTGDGNYNIFYPAFKSSKYQDDAIMNMLGQIQSASNDLAHLSAYNYMVATNITSLTNDTPFKPAVAILRIEVPPYTEAGEPHTLKSLTLSLDKQITDGKDEEEITVAQKAFDGTPLLKSKHLTMTFEEYRNGDAVTAYMAVLPTTLKKGGKLYLSATYINATGTSVKHYSSTASTGINADIILGKALVHNVSIDSDKWKDDNSTVIQYTGEVTGAALTGTFIGGGTAEEPYLISTGGDLQKLINDVNAGTNYAGKYFKLTKDIHITATAWVPIGINFSKPFSGSFDGCGHTISGLMTWTSVSDADFGFFGRISGGTIKNLHVSADVVMKTITDIDVDIDTYTFSVGGLAGSASISCLINCTMSGNVTAAASFSIYQPPLDAGGIVGHLDMQCKITSCNNYGNISADNSGNIVDAGGIIGSGYDAGCYSYCSNYGSVIGWGKYLYVGGIIGVSNGSIKYCRNEGTIEATGTGDGSVCSGGIAGAFHGNMHTSHNTSKTIKATTDPGTKYPGAIVGINNSLVYNCCSSVDVLGVSLIGYPNTLFPCNKDH